MKQLKSLFCVGIILVFSQVLQAQILNLTDEQCVELSLDLIRKGIQQEDTNKVNTVLGPNVLVRGVDILTKGSITQNFGQIFANSSKRVRAKGVREVSSDNSGLKNSNLWDFDILSPNITIKGDSAFVECELVLWGAVSGDITKVGTRMSERLVFHSPYQGQTSNTASRNPFRWKLVGCNNIFEFLTGYGESAKTDNSGEGTK